MSWADTPRRNVEGKPGTTTMTMAAAAEYLGIGITTFKENYLRWGIPHYPLGRRVMFRAGDLEDWLKSRRQEGPRKR